MSFKIFEQRSKNFNYEIVKTEPIENLYKYKDHRRLKVFYNKGVECVECGLTASLIGHGKDKFGNIHKDVYTDDMKPLNVDHIIPKSKGGSNHISNLQPMCYDCNRNKGNKLSKDDIKKGVYKKYYTDNKKKKSSDIEVGDVVYKERTNKQLGKVIEIKPNPKHPLNALSAVIKEQDPNSLYNLNSLYKKI